MASVSIKGLDKLKKKLRESSKLTLAKEVVRINGGELDNRISRGASFTKGYSTGETKRSIMTTIKDDGLTSVTKPGTHYSPYLEYGTRFMDAQPFVKPHWNVQKEIFKTDIDKLVK